MNFKYYIKDVKNNHITSEFSKGMYYFASYEHIDPKQLLNYIYWWQGKLFKLNSDSKNNYWNKYLGDSQ